MHPAAYIPTSVPPQFLRTYNLETVGRGKEGGVSYAVLGVPPYSATNEQLL